MAKPSFSMAIAEFAEVNVLGRHDLVDGQLWSLPPATIGEARCATRLICELSLYASDVEGAVYAGELGFELDPVGRTVLCPDVSYVRADRVPGKESTGFFPGPPDLAVEVVSHHEPQHRVQTKVARYLSAETALIWCVYPEQKQAVVYAQDDPPRILGEEDVLDGGSVLPGFTLPLATLFA